MIKNNFFSRSLVIGIIILLLGASVLPSIKAGWMNEIEPMNVTDNTDISAKLNAYLYSSIPYKVGFFYGTSNDIWAAAASPGTGAQVNPGMIFSEVITGLSLDTTYHWWVWGVQWNDVVDDPRPDVIYGGSFMTLDGSGSEIAEIDFDLVNYGDVVESIWNGVNGDIDMSTQFLPTIRNIGTAPIRLEVRQDDCNFGQSAGVWNVEYKARLSSNGVFTDPYSPFEQIQIPGILYVGQEESLSFSIQVIKGIPGITYYGTMILKAIQTEAPYEEESFTINLIVKIVNDMGNSPPIVKCKWEYDQDVIIMPPEPDGDPYCPYHDTYPNEPGLQVNPDLGSNVDVGYYAIVTDPNGPDHVDHVYVDIWHPNGEFKYQIELYPVGFDIPGIYDKLKVLNEWEHVKTEHLDLITFNEDWVDNLPPQITPLEDIYFELDNEEAYLYFGYAQISYCQPAGYYSVGIRAIDNYDMWSDYLFNQFWYIPTPYVYIDFKIVDYGDLTQKFWKSVDGDELMDTPLKPTIKNIGNVPVYLTIKQDDMKFGKRIVNGVEKWNVEYKTRLDNELYTAPYNPEEEVVIPGYLGMGTQEKLDFSIYLIKGYPSGGLGYSYEGVMELSAHIYGDPDDWLSPLTFDPAPYGVPQQSPIPINTDIGPIGDEKILTIDISSNVLGDTHGTDMPLLKCKWEYDLDNNHDASDEPGLQVVPIPGGNVKVGYYAIVTDPQGPDQIDGVFADVWHYNDVWHPDFNIQVELLPFGFPGNYDKNVALNEWNHVFTEHLDLLSINNDWAGYLPPGTNWFEEISYELDQEEAYLFFGWADLSYLQHSGEYTVGAVAFDALNTWSGYLYNQFFYMPAVSVQLDFNSVNYGNVVECNWNYKAGDHDMTTPNMPTIRNNGNVPVKLYIKQDDMGFGTRIVDGVEEWNVEYKARLSSEGTWTSIYSPDEETEIPGVIYIGQEEKLDFSIHAIKGFPFDEPYTGTMTLTAVQTEAPYNEQTYTINLVANVIGSYGDGAPIIKCKWEYDLNVVLSPPEPGSDPYCQFHDAYPFEEGLQVNPNLGSSVLVGYYAIVTDPQGPGHIDHVYADVYYPNGDLKYTVELLPVGFDTYGNYDKTMALNEWEHVKTEHLDLVTVNEEWTTGLPPGTTWMDDVNFELNEQEAYLFFGWAKLSYLEAGGDYTVGVNSLDGLDIWSDYLYNQFEYFGEDQVPVAEAGGPYIGYLYEQINFDASSSYDPDGSIIGYRWDWENDGIYDTPWLSSPVLGYLFEENQEKQGTLKLEIKDNKGAYATDTVDIDISKNLSIMAVYLAKQIFDAPYATGGRGEDLVDNRFVDSPEIKVDGYNYDNGQTMVFGPGIDSPGLIFWSYNRAFFGNQQFTLQEYKTRPIYYYSADGQYRDSERITKDELMPGDFLFFNEVHESPNDKGLMDHIAMYVDYFTYNDRVYNAIHASEFTGKVVPALYNFTSETLKTIKPDTTFELLTVEDYGRMSSEDKGMDIIGKSPIELVVTDPNGLVITKAIGEVPGMYYMKYDTNGDGDIDDIVSIPVKIPGDYLINVIPESGADPTDTYTLEIISEGTSIILAENVPINNIPEDPYKLRSTETQVINIIPATIDFDPNTLKLTGTGKWVTCYIELTEYYNVDDIMISTIKLNNVVFAQTSPTSIDDYDSDGIPDLMVKFSRSAVAQILQPGDNVAINIIGKLSDVIQFEGTDYIKVIQ